MARRKGLRQMLQPWYVRQDNTRGMGLARDVRAGQAQSVKRGALQPRRRRRPRG